MKTRKYLINAVRYFSLAAIITLFCFFSIAIKVRKMADDVWKQLGLPLPEANMNIRNSMVNGTLYYYGAKNARAVAAGNRAAMVNEMFVYARKYTSSAEFKSNYQKYINGLKPKVYEYVPETAESIKARERQRLEASLKSAQDGLNSTNPKIKNGAPMRIENVKKEIAALNDPENKTIKRLIENEKKMHESVIKQNEDQLKKFEEKFPPDPQVMIKKRLEEILKITADVDYAAELKDIEWRGKKLRGFVKPEYERKSKEWKLAFRAGKPATDAVRAAAEKWLKEFK